MWALVLNVGGLEGASLTGKVLTGDSGLYVEGATVELEELEREQSTQRGGSYFFGSLEPGRYTLVVTYLGYETARREVQVEEGLTVEPDLLLEPPGGGEMETLATFQVSGVSAGQAKAINLRKESTETRDVISSDAFGRFVDRNVAEALSRIPGVTVEDSQGEGKFINVRGLEAKYNPISIDGVGVATPEEDGRSVGLNIISTDQLERIEVKKTWLPNESGNVFGGSVNLVTRSALDRDETFASLELAGGQYAVSDSDSYRANAVVGTVFKLRNDWRMGVQLSLNLSDQRRGSETLETDGWDTLANPDLINPPSGFLIDDLALEDYRIQRERIGYGGTLELEFRPESRLIFSFSQNEFDDDEIRQETEYNISNNVNAYTGLKTLTVDLAAELGVDPAEVPRDLTYEEAVQLGDIAYDPVNRNFVFYRQEIGPDKSWRQTITNDEISTYSLKWKHRFNENWSAEATVRLSEASKDWTRQGLSMDGDSGGGSVTIGPDPYRPVVVGGRGLDLEDPELYRLNRNLGNAFDNEYFSEETREGGRIDVKHDAQVWGGRFRLVTEAGIDIDKRDKAFRRDFTSYSEIETSPLPELRLSDPIFFGGEDLDDFLEDHGDYRFGPYFNDRTTVTLFDEPDGIELIQTPDDVNSDFTDAVLTSYEATEDIIALYLMQRLSWEDWQVVYGFRFERTENSFTNNQIETRTDNGVFISPGLWRFLEEEDFSEAVRVNRNYSHFLPALHIRKGLTEDLFVRFAGTRTISRPQFDELVPREIISIDGAQFGRSIQLPNIELEAAESNNFDLGVDWYLGSVDLLSVTLFYKDLDGVIFTESRVLEAGEEIVPELVEKYVSSGLDTGTWRTRRKANSGPGYVYGAEFSIQKELNFLPSPLDGLGVDFNISVAESEVELLLEERFQEAVPLFRQSDTTSNFSIIYDKYGLFFRLGFQYRDDYLLNVAAGREQIGDLTREDRLNLPANSLDQMQDSSLRIDFTARYQLNEHLSFFYEGTNLNNEPRRRYYGNPSRLSSVQYTEAVHFAGVKLLW